MDVRMMPTLTGWIRMLLILIICQEWGHIATPFSMGEHGRGRQRDGNGMDQGRLKVITIQAQPYVWLRWDPGYLGNDRYQGFYMDLMQSLAGEMGLGYQMQLMADGKIGNRGETGEWNGLLGEIMRQSADIALAPIAVTKERESLVNFTIPLSDATFTLITKKAPGENAYVRDNTAVLQNVDQYGVIRGSDAYTLLRHTNYTGTSVLWRDVLHRRPHTVLSSINEGLDRVRRGRFSLILEEKMANYYVRQEPCDIKRVGSFISGHHMALAVRNDAAFIRSVNGAMATLLNQDAIWRRLYRKWWSSECPDVEDLEPSVSESLTGKREDSDTSERSVNTESPIPHLTIATIMEEPYFIRSSPGVRPRYTGYVVDLIEAMSKVIPFTYQWMVEKRKGKHKRGQWTGLVGRLDRQEADIGAVAFAPNGRIESVLELTKPFLHSTLSILLSSPPDGSDFSIFIMDDLINQTKVDVGVVRGGRPERLLRRSNSPLYRELWQRVINPIHPREEGSSNIMASLDQGLKLVRQGQFALILENTEAALVSFKQPCDLVGLDQFMAIMHYSLALRIGNPLIAHVNDALIQLQETGTLQMLFHKWWYSDECMGQTQNPRLVEIEATFEYVTPTHSQATTTTTTAATEPTTATNSPTSNTTTRTTSVSPTTPELAFETTEFSTEGTRRNKKRKRKKNRTTSTTSSSLTTEPAAFFDFRTLSTTNYRENHSTKKDIKYTETIRTTTLGAFGSLTTSRSGSQMDADGYFSTPSSESVDEYYTPRSPFDLDEFTGKSDAEESDDKSSTVKYYTPMNIDMEWVVPNSGISGNDESTLDYSAYDGATNNDTYNSSEPGVEVETGNEQNLDWFFVTKSTPSELPETTTVVEPETTDGSEAVTQSWDNPVTDPKYEIADEKDNAGETPGSYSPQIKSYIITVSFFTVLSCIFTIT